MLALQRPMQVADLFFDFLAALLSVVEDVVGVADFFFPFIVHAPKTGCVVLLQVLQRLDKEAGCCPSAVLSVVEFATL